MAEYMIPEWADYFEGLSFEQLDELAASWKFENCIGRQRLNDTLSLYATMKPNDTRLEGKVVLSMPAEEHEKGGGVFELSPSEKSKSQTKIKETIVVS